MMPLGMFSSATMPHAPQMAATESKRSPLEQARTMAAAATTRVAKQIMGTLLNNRSCVLSHRYSRTNNLVLQGPCEPRPDGSTVFSGIHRLARQTDRKSTRLNSSH